MSYSRWSDDSVWYAFPTYSETDPLWCRRLSLWHRDEEQRPTWTYSELCGVDRKWLRSRYPSVSDDDLGEALWIISEFQEEMEWKDLKEHFPKLKDAIRCDPSPRNLGVLFDVLLDRFRKQPATDEILDFLFSLPSPVWENHLLFAVEIMDVRTVCNAQDRLVEALPIIDHITDKDRLLATLRHWVGKLPRQIDRNRRLNITFGPQPTGEKILDAAQAVLARFESEVKP